MLSQLDFALGQQSGALAKQHGGGKSVHSQTEVVATISLDAITITYTRCALGDWEANVPTNGRDSG